MIKKQSKLNDIKLEDFKNGIGKPFKIAGFNGLLGKHDTIIAVDEKTGQVKGNWVSAHFSDCRFIQEQPKQFKKQ